MSFLENISDLKACGTVGAKQMLKCIHRYSTTIDRKKAFLDIIDGLISRNTYNL